VWRFVPWAWPARAFPPALAASGLDPGSWTAPDSPEGVVQATCTLSVVLACGLAAASLVWFSRRDVC
jgi:hypothetical protein